MKFTFFATLCVFSFHGFAQNMNGDSLVAGGKASPSDVISVFHAPAIITIDTQPGPLSVLIPQAEAKVVEKDWARYVGQGSTGKAATANGQYSQYGAVNKNISPEPFNITARFLGTTDGVKLTVWLSDNNNFENSKQPVGDRNMALQKYVRDFAVTEYKIAVMDELKADMAKQKEMESDMARLIKSENKAVKKMEEDKRAIAKANDDIVTNNKDIASAGAQIESQKGMVQSTAADPNATKGAKKTLGQLEDDKKNLIKKNGKAAKSIDIWNEEIKAEEKTVAEAKEKQVLMGAQIEKQKQVVHLVQAKLDGIK